MMISQYLPAFETMLLESDRRPRTVSGYIKDLQDFNGWFLKNHPLSHTLTDITPLDVRNYRDHLQHHRKLAPATINRRLAGLRVFLEFAVDKTWLSHNPAVKIHGLKQVPHAPRWLTRAEQQRLRRALEREIQYHRAESAGRLSLRVQHAIRNRALFLLLLNTGLRSMELMQLTLDDIEMNERHGSLFVRDGKGGKSRSLPLNREARQALQDYLAIRPNLDTPRLFVGQRGPIGTRQLQRLLKKYCWLAHLDVKLANVRALRHTFGKNLVDAGVSLDRVATLLGHASLNTTRIYTTPNEDDLRQAVERLANV